MARYEVIVDGMTIKGKFKGEIVTLSKEQGERFVANRYVKEVKEEAVKKEVSKKNADEPKKATSKDKPKSKK